jgi:hypothetical protein
MTEDIYGKPHSEGSASYSRFELSTSATNWNLRKFNCGNISERVSDRCIVTVRKDVSY